MMQYLLRRLLLAIPTLLLVTVVIFLAVRLAPGDPAMIMAGQQSSEETIQKLRVELGLDQPLPAQYVRYLTGLFRLDMGRSMLSRQPASEEIFSRFPTTLTLALLATMLSVILGVVLGVTAATRQHTWIDYGSMVLSTVGMSIPNFVLGLVLMLVFAVQLHWLPATGASTERHYILPALTLALPGAAVLARQTRSCVLDVLREDYVRTATAKGLSSNRVIYRHVLRNALVPVLTIIGQQFGTLLAGAVIVESVFGVPGIGYLLVGRIAARDYPVVQGTVLVAACSFVFVNLLVDLAYAFVNPQIRYSS
jgi:ABC-type dipeptide/oligopeptide/nickel transport system permease component